MGIVALSGLRGGLSLFVLEAFLDSNLTANLTQILLISMFALFGRSQAERSS